MHNPRSIKNFRVALRIFLLCTVLVLQTCARGASDSRLPDTSSPFGFHPAKVNIAGYTNNGYEDAQYIGVSWTRHELYAYWCKIEPDIITPADPPVYDFSQYDNRWSGVPDGISVLANISIEPSDNSCSGYTQAGSYFPVDETKYTAFVKATVERYSSPGVLSNPIKYWQVGNEPNISKTGFVELQRITYTAIKEVCPDCKVVIGGVAGTPPVNIYLNYFDTQYKPILDALAGEYIDIIDFHWYGNATGDYRGAKEVYHHIRSVLNADGFPPIPIWISEMGSYSGDPIAVSQMVPDYPPQTERQQALDYIKRFIYPLSFGVKKIFPAFGLMEGLKYDGGYFDYTGLIYDGWDLIGGTGDLGLGVKKLGYFAYKKMTEMLDGSDLNHIQILGESDYVYVYGFVKNGALIYVAWWDYFDDPAYASGATIKNISLNGLQGSTVFVTEALPKFSTGAEVSDYNNAFNTQTLSIANGSISLSLGDSPVYIQQ